MKVIFKEKIIQMTSDGTRLLTNRGSIYKMIEYQSETEKYEDGSPKLKLKYVKVGDELPPELLPYHATPNQNN